MVPRPATMVNRRTLAGVLLLVAVATGQVHLGLGAVIAATVVIEVLTWMAPLTSGRDAGHERRPT